MSQAGMVENNDPKRTGFLMSSLWGGVRGRNRLFGYKIPEAFEGLLDVREGLSKKGNVILDIEQISFHEVHLCHHVIEVLHQLAAPAHAVFVVSVGCTRALVVCAVGCAVAGRVLGCGLRLSRGGCHIRCFEGDMQESLDCQLVEALIE